MWFFKFCNSFVEFIAMESEWILYGMRRLPPRRLYGFWDNQYFLVLFFRCGKRKLAMFLKHLLNYFESCIINLQSVVESGWKSSSKALYWSWENLDLFSSKIWNSSSHTFFISLQIILDFITETFTDDLEVERRILQRLSFKAQMIEVNICYFFPTYILLIWGINYLQNYMAEFTFLYKQIVD